MLTFLEFKRALSFSQPKLALKEVDGCFVASGSYCLTDGPHKDGPIEEFEILLVADGSYPKSEPALRETQGRIPRDIDRHMFRTGDCCTCVWEEWLETTPDPSFAAFCDGPVRDFFLSQLHFEDHEEWPFGERKHGMDGLLESVSRILGFKVTNIEAIQYLNTITGGEPKGHWTCTCGSRLKIRDCDPQHIVNLRQRLGLDNMTRLKEHLRRSIRLR